MSSLTMDGGNRIVGTEFVKLLITGSSNLATEEYVDDKVAEGGGGGGNVDLSNYYTQTETDNLLNAKLNVSNPQDIIGHLRLDPTNGNSKIILNAVAPATASDDFYCNGNGQFNGSLRVSLLTSDGDVNCDGVNADTFNSNVITNDIVLNHNDNEYMRFQVSDNTVRVPNTRSFLSQDIYLDNLRPLTFSNDVVFNGGNSTNDAYEEYVRLDASTEKVSISKETKFENAIQLNQGQSIKWTNVFIREVQGASRPEFDIIVNGSTSHLRLWVNGAIKQAITNTSIACKVNIDAEQGLTVFNGQQLKSNTINSHTNSNLVIQRSGSTAITLKAGNEVDFSGYVNSNNISTENDTDMAIRRNDEEFIHLFKNETTSDEAIICYKILRANEELKTNTLNTLDDNSLNIQQNGDAFISLQSIANRVQVNRLLRVVDGGNSIQAQLVQSNTGNYMSFTLGNHISAYTSGDSEADPPVPVNGNILHLNYYSHGNVFLGTNQNTGEDPAPTITINKFSSDTGNAFEVQGDSVFSGTVSTNTLNSETGDLVFQRLGTEFFRLNDQSSLIEVAVGHAFSSPDVYANDY